NPEAVQHLTTGLALLATLPETPARAQQELDLRTALGPALMATKGFAAPEVEQTYARARVLCQQVGDTPRLFPTLQGLCRFYNNHGTLQTAQELGDQLLRLAPPRAWHTGRCEELPQEPGAPAPQPALLTPVTAPTDRRARACLPSAQLG